jgi:hypothetical protein
MTTGVVTGGGQANVGQPHGGQAHFQLFAAQAQSAVRWRLLSGNNRDLGRSVESYPDAASCLVAIKELVVMLDVLQPQVRRRGPNQWQWALLIDTRAVVSGAHAYDRQVRCDQAVRQFLEPRTRAGAALAPARPRAQRVTRDLLVSRPARFVPCSASSRPLVARLGCDHAVIGTGSRGL